MTNNYKDYKERHIASKKKVYAAKPLSNEEKAELKMRIMLAINNRMA